MATTRASARKSRAASGQIVPANKTAKDNPLHFDRTNNDRPEMPPRWSTPEKVESPRNTNSGWVHQASRRMVSPNERCFNDTSAKDIWLPALKIGETTAVYISTRERDFKPITRIIADRDTGNACRLAVCDLHSRIPRPAAHRLRGSLCFAALWYANSLIHGKQTCAALTKLLGASGHLQNERRRMRKLGQVPPALKSSLTDFPDRMGKASRRG